MNDKREILKSKWYLVLVYGTHMEIVGGAFDSREEALPHARGLEKHENLYIVEGKKIIEQRDEINVAVQDKRP